MKFRNLSILALLSIVVGFFLLNRDRLFERDSPPETIRDQRPHQEGRQRGERGLTAIDHAKRMARLPEVNPEEQRAIDQAIDRKFAVRTALKDHVMELFEVAMDPDATDERLSKAMDDYREFKKRYDERIREIDQGLTKNASVRTRARMLSAGILDNGLGVMVSARGANASTTGGSTGAAGPMASGPVFATPASRPAHRSNSPTSARQRSGN
jgi:hypothetical protein